MREHEHISCWALYSWSFINLANETSVCIGNEIFMLDSTQALFGPNIHNEGSSALHLRSQQYLVRLTLQCQCLEIARSL